MKGHGISLLDLKLYNRFLLGATGQPTQPKEKFEN